MLIMKKIVAFIFLLCLVFFARAKNVSLSPKAEISILTCSPGPDLYSSFGHTALRIQDSINGKWVDVVYNYGTFQFSDDFYYKFAKGQLDYRLSRSSFGDFQYEYLMTGRGIWEQKLMISLPEKQRLFDLLEENYLPANREYRYDFFYDNCSTRVRDIIKKAINNQVNFTYVYPERSTYREAIQRYLDFHPWSDFGIDVALGIPCDKVMEAEGAMFLPDSLMKELNFASHGDGPLVSRAEEVIPQEYESELDSSWTPVKLFSMILIIQLVLGWLFRKKYTVNLFDRILMFAVGLVGVLVTFLWFFTDHQATVWNLNILWANPLLLVVAFLPSRMWKRMWWNIYGIGALIAIIGWPFLPQQLHVAVIPLALSMIWVALRYLRPHWLGIKPT